MSPAEADECEIWQLAVLLGADRPVELSEIDRLAARVENEKDSLRERAAKAGRISEPQEEPSGPVDMTEQIMRQMGISTR